MKCVQPDSLKSTNGIFEEYINDVQPVLLWAEQCYGNALPIAFSLEFRSIVTHIYRAERRKEADQPLSKEDVRSINGELDKASRHLLRIRLDCLKLICITLEERTQDAIAFMDNECPIRYIDDGTFLTNIVKTQIEARNAFEEAKKADCVGDSRTLGLYEHACSCYRALADLVGLRFVTAPDAELVQRYQSLRDEERKAKRRGWILFLVGVVVAVVAFLLEVL